MSYRLSASGDQNQLVATDDNGAMMVSGHSGSGSSGRNSRGSGSGRLTGGSSQALANTSDSENRLTSVDDQNASSGQYRLASGDSQSGSSANNMALPAPDDQYRLTGPGSGSTPTLALTNTTPNDLAVANKMERGDENDGQIKLYEDGELPSSLRKLEGVERMEVRQSRRGCIQEMCCCNHKSEFDYIVREKRIAMSREEYSLCCRVCCPTIHAWDMTVQENSNTREVEIIDIERPYRLPLAPCKICCRQEATISSGDEDLGEVRETFWCCVPQFKVYDDDDETVYIVHPATCCGGSCVNCCVEGNCCPHGCHLVPWRVYSADAYDTAGDAPFIGRIAKIPKETFSDVYNESQSYELSFPEDSTKELKGLLLGSSLLINSNLFEGSE